MIVNLILLGASVVGPLLLIWWDPAHLGPKHWKKEV